MTKSSKSRTFLLAEPLEPRLLLSGELAGYQLVVADLSGAPVSIVEVGQNFQLQVYAQDLRSSPQGVFAGFLDVLYDHAKVHPAGSLAYGSDFPNFHVGDQNTAGLLDEVGAIAGLTPLGGGAKLLFSLGFHADAAGSFNFTSNTADVSPMHDTLLYGDDDPITQISFGLASLQVNAAAPPTASLADPANGEVVTDAAINGRHYLDVTFADTGGSGLDASTINGDEFTLSGAAASGVTLSGVPTLVGGTTSTYRYTFTGSFALGPVTVHVNAASFADQAGHSNVAGADQNFTVVVAESIPPTASLAGPANGGSITDFAINSRGYLDVTFADTGGSGLNPASITDAGAEFTLSGAAAGGVTLDGAATLVPGTASTYRYSFTGSFTTGAVTVSLAAGSFADLAGNTNVAAADQSLTVTSGQVAYILRLTDLGGSELSRDGANYVLSAGDSFIAEVWVDDLRSAGAAGGAFAAFADLTYASDQIDWQAGTLVHGSDFPNFQSGTIDEADSLVDEAGGMAGLTPLGADPARLLFKVTGKVKDEVAAGGFTLALNPADSSPAHDTLVYGSDNPVPVDQIGYDQWTVEIAPDLTSPAATLADPADGGSITDLAINGRQYIDVTFADAGGSGIDPNSITDDAAEFTLSGAAASGVTVNGHATRIGSTNTYLYSYAGNFTPGTVTAHFVPGSFADAAGNPSVVVADQSFTVTPGDATPPTATLADPADGGSITSETLNGRHSIDVTFADTGGSGLDLSTINGDEFAFSGPAASGVTISGAPALVSGTTSTYRYTFAGSFAAGVVTVTFTAGRFADQSGNPNGGAIQSFTVTDVNPPTAGLAHPAGGGAIGMTTVNSAERYLDVTFADTGGSGLDLATINGDEFTLSGAAAGGVTISTAPAWVSDTTSTYRYSFTGDFGLGQVTVTFAAGGFADLAGNPTTGGTATFNVTDTMAPTATLAHPANGGAISQTTINGTERYLDVTFADAGGSGLDSSTITDADAEFSLSGAAAGGVVVNGAAALVSGTTSTYRYSFTGNFGIGVVTVNYQAGGFADQAGNPSAAWAESFTILSALPHIVITDDSGAATDRTVALPTAALGATSAPQVFTLTNVGMKPLTVSGLKLAGAAPADFNVIVKSDSGAAVTAKKFTIPAGASYTVEVRLKPALYSGLRATSALLTFKTNDGLKAKTDTSVSLTMTGTVADSVGDTPATAASIGPIGKKATKLSGYVGPGDADDYFTFTVPADPVKLASKVTLKLTNLIGGADLYLYAADGKTMLASSIKPGKAADSIVKSLSPGTYVLRVAAFASVLTRYTLSLTATT